MGTTPATTVIDTTAVDVTDQLREAFRRLSPEDQTEAMLATLAEQALIIGAMREQLAELDFLRPYLPMIASMIADPQAHLGPMAKMMGLGRLFG